MYLPSFLLVGGVAGFAGCAVDVADFVVVDTVADDDLAVGCDTVGVTEAVTIGDTGYLGIV